MAIIEHMDGHSVSTLVGFYVVCVIWPVLYFSISIRVIICNIPELENYPLKFYGQIPIVDFALTIDLTNYNNTCSHEIVTHWENILHGIFDISCPGAL